MHILGSALAGGLVGVMACHADYSWWGVVLCIAVMCVAQALTIIGASKLALGEATARCV
jgi:hypothetical protein